ncbi:MAG: trypsin-like serine peptidase [Janthinobacterium lividum]
MTATERRRIRGHAVVPTAALTCALATVVLTFAGAPSGSAAAAAGGPAGSASLLSSAGVADRQAAQEYWTPERMATAQPASTDAPKTLGTAEVTSTTKEAVSTPAVATGTRSTLAAGTAPRLARGVRSTDSIITGGAVSVSQTYGLGGPVTAKVGRLYFRQAGRDYVCSASSVEAKNSSVIVTAGHCVTDNGAPSTDAVFVPGLDGDYEPFGKWPVSSLYTTPQWMTGNQSSSAALNYDVGFAVVAPKNGTTLADTVGTLDIGFDATLQRVTVFGYPAAGGTSNGNTLKYCTGWRFADTHTTDQGTNCTMTGGSSGGPWVSRFSAATGSGTVTSVVSFSYDDAPTVLYGPRFGAEVRAVYDKASAVTVS